MLLSRIGRSTGTRLAWLTTICLSLLLLPFAPASTSLAQGTPGNSRTFPETGKTVSGRFLDYWNTHGGLAQQGFPISNEMQEVSETNGKTYTVQYFERAVFELHPENQPPNDVLLSLLGVFFYKQKYPNGAPNQTASTAAGAVLFPETGKHLGGRFLDYWRTHGGLAQQGYPISEEFSEVSATNGKTYTVQYFERAVFELHPENQPPNDVLLSLLGVFQYQRKYANGGTPGTGATPTVPTGGTAAPSPTATTAPTQGPAACDKDVPAAVSASVTPRCGPVGTVFEIQAFGFKPGEAISFWLTTPQGQVAGTPAPLDIGNHPGGFQDEFDSSFLAQFGSQVYGIWAITYQGADSNHQSIVWFKITQPGGGGGAATPTPVPGGGGGVPAGCEASNNRDATVNPAAGPAGTRFAISVFNFQANEDASYWFTDPQQRVIGSEQTIQIGPNGSVNLTFNSTGLPTGHYALTVHGRSSGHESIANFCITP
jgi:hypothetical protein